MFSSVKEEHLVCSYFFVESFENAAQLSRVLLSEHLAAAVLLLPSAHLFFQWENAMEEKTGTTMLVFSPRENTGEIHRRVQEIHPTENLLSLTIAISSFSEFTKMLINNMRSNE